MFEFFIDIWLLMLIIVLDSMDDIGMSGDDMINCIWLIFILQNIDLDVINVIVSVMYNGMIILFIVIQGVGGWSFILLVLWGDGDYMLMVIVEDWVGNMCLFMLLMVIVDM